MLTLSVTIVGDKHQVEEVEEVVVLVEVEEVEEVVVVLSGEGVPQGEGVLLEDVVLLSEEGVDSKRISILCNFCFCFNHFVWMVFQFELMLNFLFIFLCVVGFYFILVC